MAADFNAAMFALLTGAAGKTTASQQALAKMIGNRVYHQEPPQEPGDSGYPLINYQRISGADNVTNDGPDGLEYPRVQFTVIARDGNQAKALADAVDANLHGIVSGVAAGVTIQSSLRHDRADVLYASAGVQQRRLVGIRLDYIIWFEN